MTRPTVLVAEDDADLRDLVALTLADAGIDVELAGDGREALALIVDHRPDLVLLDLMMPVMDGFAFCSELRAIANPPRVVVMTAAHRAAQTAKDVGAVGWLAKPFDIDELVATVQRHVRG